MTKYRVCVGMQTTYAYLEVEAEGEDEAITEADGQMNEGVDIDDLVTDDLTDRDDWEWLNSSEMTAEPV